MATRRKVTYTVHGKETFIPPKPLRDEKGHFIKRTATPNVPVSKHVSRIPKADVSETVEMKPAKPVMPEHDEKRKPEPPVTIKKDKSGKKPVVVTRALVPGNVVIPSEFKPTTVKKPKSTFVRMDSDAEYREIRDASLKDKKDNHPVKPAHQVGLTGSYKVKKIPAKSGTSLSGVSEKLRLWRYHLKGIEMFKLSEQQPTNDSESLLTFYDTKRDLIALKRAIRQYEDSQSEKELEKSLD